MEYLKQRRRGTLARLRMEFKLNSYLYDINSQAEEMFDTLIKQFKQAEGITEQLKVDNQMEWLARMNNIRSRATEIINQDIIYK
ncbi:MAG: TnpV protein [Clostridia bacterium]|nr:TnpV protein [Clostridia bacterium]